MSDSLKPRSTREAVSVALTRRQADTAPRQADTAHRQADTLPPQPADTAAEPVDVEGSSDRLRLPDRIEDLWHDRRIRLAWLRELPRWLTLAMWFAVMLYAFAGRPDLNWYWLWLLVMVFFIVVEWFLTRDYNAVLLSQAENRTARCAACGYALAGLVEGQTLGRCPECGRPFRAGDKPYITRQERLTWRSLVRTMTLSILVSAACLASGVFAISRGEPLAWWYVAFGLASATAVIIATSLIGRQRMNMYRVPTPTAFPCVQCAAELHTPLPDQCPACQRAIRAEDVFVRCSPWNLADSRYRPMHRRGAFESVMANGLIMLGVGIYLIGQNKLPVPTFLQSNWQAAIQSLGSLNSLLILALTTFAVMSLRRHAATRWGQRVRLLFTQAVPTCPACEADLTGQLVRGSCPNCSRPYTPSDLHG